MRAIILLAIVLAACSAATTDLPPETEFALLDANPESARFGTLVSPRQHLGHVTVWYFGSAT